MTITNETELADAIHRMRSAGTDLFEYEVKTASGGLPKETAETISAFANTSGGVIIFGISEKNNFQTVDIDVKAIQAGVAQAARERVEPPQSIEVLVLQFEEKPVVVANIAETSPQNKPCFVKRHGKINGSFMRTGDGDHRLSIYEIDRLIENQHRETSNDTLIVNDASLEDLDQELLTGWLSRVRKTSSSRVAAMSDEHLLAVHRIIARDSEGNVKPTLAGLLAMGAYPQSFFPRLNVVFTAYPTPEKGEIGTDGARFKDAINIDGSIPAMVVETLLAASRNMAHKSIIKGALRENVPDYPLAAIREAIANALMHRDYSKESHGTPVMVDMYPDRLEISSPGGLFGTSSGLSGEFTIDELIERTGTASRNQFLSRILEDVPYTDYDGRTGRVVENRGSGFPVIKHETQAARMYPPIARNTLSSFSLTFKQRRMSHPEESAYSRKNVTEVILTYLQEEGNASVTEISTASGISNKTIRKYIAQLLDDEQIEAIGALNSPKRRYRINK